jgi:DNA polymerase
LRAQVALIRPKVIVLLGASALKAVLGPAARITRDRGQWVERKGVWILPTFHPAALLRDETKKRPFWEDMKLARDKVLEIQNTHEQN